MSLRFAPHFCDDPAAPPVTDQCVRGCRWLVRVLDGDINRNGDRWSLSALGDVAARLPLRPLRAYRDGGVLTHPPDDLSPEREAASTVGVFESAWVKEERLVLAVVHLWHSVTKLHRLLLAMERRGHLIGRTRVSLVARARLHPEWPSLVLGVPAVVAVDLVTRPGCRDAGVIRSLTDAEFTVGSEPAIAEAAIFE